MTQHNLTPSQFIQEKFGGPFEGHLILWEKQTKRTFSYTADALDQLDAKVTELAPAHDLYIAIGTQVNRPPKGKRGGAATVRMLPGLFGDIDLGEAKDQPNK